MPSELEISPEETKKLLDSKLKVQLVDVREEFEHAICSIKRAKLIPVGELESRLNELDRSVPVIAYCHHGRRSLLAARILSARGFNAKSMAGGIDDWSVWIDQKVPRY
ncbi:MAG: rhodanese-like domain-containing protein [archaeon]